MRSFAELFKDKRRQGPTMAQLDQARRRIKRGEPVEFTYDAWRSDRGFAGFVAEEAPVSAAFPKVSADRGGIQYTSATTESTSTYYNPTDPTETGAKMETGDLWVDPGNGRVQVWNGSGWTEVVDPTGRGGFFGDGRTGFEEETAEDRWKREAERADGDAIRLGDHWARRGEDGDWACEACGSASADAGILAETDCG